MHIAFNALLTPIVTSHWPPLVSPTCGVRLHPMLDCQACVHRCLGAIYAHALGPGQIRRITTSQLPARKLGRIAATSSRGKYTALASHSQRNGPGKEVFASKSAEGTPLVRNVAADPTQRALEQELRFLRDPLKLAENTVILLKNGQDEKAGQLVRMASKSMACTVSWNHMIDYEMSKGRVSRAMTIYNDVRIS